MNLSLSPGQAGAPVVPGHPGGASAAGDAGQPDDDAAGPAERLLAPGQPRGGAAGRPPGHRRAWATPTCAATGLLMAINQNVPSCPPSGTNNGCRPIPDYAQQQPVLLGRRVGVPRRCSSRSRSGPRSWGYYRVSYTLSKAENNVGEFFFSGPIDPLRPVEGLGPGGQRPAPPVRVLGRCEHVDGAGVDGVAGHHARLPAERACVQAYSAAPFNITSGVTTVQGIRRSADRRRRVHSPQLGSRRRVLQPWSSPKPLVPAGRRDASRSDSRGVQPDQRRQRDRA